MEVWDLISGHGEYYIQNLAIIILILGVIYLFIRYKTKLGGQTNEVNYKEKIL